MTLEEKNADYLARLEALQAETDAATTLSITESATTVSVQVTFDAALLHRFVELVNSGRSNSEGKARLVATLGSDERYSAMKADAWAGSRKELVSSALHLAQLMTA